MNFGNMPADGGFLLFSSNEKMISFRKNLKVPLIFDKYMGLMNLLMGENAGVCGCMAKK